MSFWGFIWENPIYILWIYLLIINLISFFSMGIDKRKAIKNKQRLPEATLFLMAIIGGSIGGIAGIYTFRHKTLHKSFTLGFPAILLLQLGVFILIYTL